MSGETVGRPMEILLVEDSLTAARLAIGALKKAPVPHRLTWLTDGEEAAEFVYRRGRFTRAPRPDLILLDLTLPKKDGRELLAEIKSDEDLQTIPVVVLTSSTDEEDVAQTPAPAGGELHDQACRHRQVSQADPGPRPLLAGGHDSSDLIRHGQPE